MGDMIILEALSRTIKGIKMIKILLIGKKKRISNTLIDILKYLT